MKRILIQLTESVAILSVNDGSWRVPTMVLPCPPERARALLIATASVMFGIDPGVIEASLGDDDAS